MAHRAGAASQSSEGASGLAWGAQQGDLLQKETSIYGGGGSNCIPAEMMLDSPNSHMRSELLVPLRDGGTEVQRGQVTHPRPHSKPVLAPLPFCWGFLFHLTLFWKGLGGSGSRRLAGDWI